MRTARDISPMMTMPRASLKWSETLARVCPPIIEFRIRKPCIENTFNAAGSIAG